MSEEDLKHRRICELRERVLDCPLDDPATQLNMLNIIGGLLNYLEDDIQGNGKQKGGSDE